MSQLFHVKFFQFVPIDSIITELEAMDEVLYAHGPVQTVSLADPDDPCFTDISGCIAGTTGVQWNLNKIDAPKAWDITKG
ncbi:MAG: hypothetical protein GWN00_13990, partial [Aliifodinibius sp.]|nr:hypothetical protein [Fodinibius sp.]NIY25877.1 hypothetical protein [Fodinibius sp.]